MITGAYRVETGQNERAIEASKRAHTGPRGRAKAGQARRRAASWA